MHQEYPKLMYGRGASTRLVHDAAEQSVAEDQGFAASPGEAHRVPHRTAGPVAPHAPEPLTEAHIPLIVEHVARALGAAPREDGAEPLTADHIPAIVEAVFDRLRGMALAASAEPGHREAAEGVAALRAELGEALEARFAALLGEVRALIAPAPVPAGKSGKV